MTLHLYLIRHGETAWSLSGQHTGSTEVPLTAAGEDEARLLAPQFRHLSFTHVFTSPRQRARRTCELAEIAAPAAIEPELDEWNYGDYEARRSVEIHHERPAWNIFHDGCPGGESPAQAAARADRLIARLRRLRGNVALFSHGHFGRVLGVRWIGLPVGDARRFLLGPAALSVLGSEPGAGAEHVVISWNRAPAAPAGSLTGPRPPAGGSNDS